MNNIPFNVPYMTGKEIHYIEKAHSLGKLSGDGFFTKACQELLTKQFSAKATLLTHSCTAALEMAALLLDLKEGDEVILPSYTFVSTANAFLLRGAVPVFVDINAETLCMDLEQLKKAININTKAIVIVHYAGFSCDMDELVKICESMQVPLIEDAAQSICSLYKGKPLGSFGDMATLSFHETKNIISGEGGALIINNSKYIERAEIIREKGTNRKQFFRGEVDKYSWVDIGSSYLPSEITAAFLYAQLKESGKIIKKRLLIWDYYHKSLQELELEGYIKRPCLLEYSTHNAHMYYLIHDNEDKRNEFIDAMKEKGINTVFHYIPLHSSKIGEQYCKVSGSMKNTDYISRNIVRMPLFIGLEEHIDKVISSTISTLRHC